ncbi:MAG: hypothetical protein PHO80_00790 [Candidatus Gracilibacteria bacterium]|nr:hypothetical protein [Candidatus Gracilibacteria bacterium]
MTNFKAICILGNKKIELIVNGENKDDVRIKLHSQGYSVIELIEIDISEIDKDNFFYFDILMSDKTIKKGQIKSEDIIKAYVKLIDDLKYNVIYIYDKKESDENNKKIITRKVQESYKIYKQTNKQKKEEESKEKTFNKKENRALKKEEESDNLLLDKKLQKYYSLVDKTILKIVDLKDNYNNSITPEQNLQLSESIIGLRQLKNITNIEQIKIKCQSLLIEVGKIEVFIIKENKDTKKIELLKETNKLLKNFGSTTSIKTGESTTNKAKRILESIFKKKEKKEGGQADKTSYSYLKSLRELNIYKKKLTKENINIFKNIIFYNSNNLKIALLRRKTISQNIEILKNRIYGKKFSYTKIIKGFSYYSDFLIYFTNKVGDFLLYVVFMYSIFFIFLLFLNKIFVFDFNINILSIIAMLTFLGFLLKVSKNFLVLLFSIVIYIVFVVYIKINF